MCDMPSLTDTSISGSRLDDGLPGFERSILLGGLDDGQSKAILHGGEGVEILALGVDGPVKGM